MKRVTEHIIAGWVDPSFDGQFYRKYIYKYKGTRMKEYLDLAHDVINNGVLKSNRTGVDTKAVFGAFYKVDLAKGYPLLTTKKMFFNSMLHETLWYISGDHHIKNLQQHTKIWDAWANEYGELETAYGRYWRYYPVPESDSAWGIEPFVDEENDFVSFDDDGNMFFDQLGWAINELETNPNNRRIVISAWHPANAVVSKLPPCHFVWVLNVLDGKLNCHLTQRSCDLPCGLPFNLACYSLLTQLIAQHVGLEIGQFAHTLIDCHIYIDQLEGIKEQLTRDPFPLPTLRIDKQETIDDYRFEHFHLENYQHHDRIVFPVAV